jgi:hypothetical protein
MARDSLLLWGAGLSAAALLYYIVVGAPGESGKTDGGGYYAGLYRGSLEACLYVALFREPFPYAPLLHPTHTPSPPPPPHFTTQTTTSRR